MAISSPQPETDEGRPAGRSIDGLYVTEEFPEGRPVGQGSSRLNRPSETAIKGVAIHGRKAKDQEATIRRNDAEETRLNFLDKNREPSTTLDEELFHFLTERNKRNFELTGESEKENIEKFRKLFWGTIRNCKKIVESELRGDPINIPLLTEESLKRIVIKRLHEALERAKQNNKKTRVERIEQIFIDIFNRISQRRGDTKLILLLVKEGLIEKEAAQRFLTRKQVLATIHDHETPEKETMKAQNLWDATIDTLPSVTEFTKYFIDEGNLGAWLKDEIIQ